MHVTAVTMKQQPVYAATLVGRPPMEDYYLGHATERIFLPLLKLTIPEIVDYHMPAEGIFHNLVFVSIDKQYPGQAYKVMNAMWGQGLMSLAKVLVIVDKEVNVHDADEVWWVALNHIDPKRDVEFVRGPVDVLDHASQHFTFGTKMGIDATRKWPEEGFTRNWPKLIEMDPATKQRVDAMWAKLGIESSAVEPEDARKADDLRGERSRPTTLDSRPAARRPDIPRPIHHLPLREFSSSCPTPSSRSRLRCWASSPPSRVAPLTARTVLLVVVAFSAARFAAMGFNRIVDREIDARNPRTSQREIPRGVITVVAASAAVAVASIVFIVAAGLLNSLCLVLSPVALAWILAYSYAKRFTHWPHLWLGLSLAIAPVGGWLAVTGRWSEPCVVADRDHGRRAHLGCRVRRFLCIAGRAVRPRRGLAERGGPPRTIARDPRGQAAARGHDSRAGAFRLGRRLRRLVFRRRGRRGGDPGLRAPAGEAG